MVGTLVPLGKNQFPKTVPVKPAWQQEVRSVRQSRASSPSPMFSSVTILLFWYVVPLSENLTLLAPEKEEIQTT